MEVVYPGSEEGSVALKEWESVAGGLPPYSSVRFLLKTSGCKFRV